jgi:exonuclease III
MDPTDIYRIFHPNTKEYTFFSTPHRSFSKIGHIVGYKASLNRYEKIKIMSCILSDHHGLKLVFNTRMSTHSWKLNNSLFNALWVRKEIKK